jgi:DNA-binding response OmpR family regulator
METENMICPCCGQEVVSDDESIIKAASLSKLQARIFRVLSRAKGEKMDAEQIADIIYHDRADGGPDFAAQTIRTTIHKLRDRIAASNSGVSIENGRGYRLVRNKPSV